MLSITHLKLALPHKSSNISLQISPGQVWLLLGPNGAGKTTFLETLAAIHKPNYGKIHWDDSQRTFVYGSKEWAEVVGILLQEEESGFGEQ